MYSMLFGNNSGGGANALLDGASFYLELTHTAVPTRGSITPTFTRATTATVQNNDGYLVTALAGEARFVGARRVRNLIVGASENFTNANWTKDGVTASADTLTTTATTAEHRAYQNPGSTTTSDLGIEAKAGTASYIGISKGTTGLYATFDLLAGTVIASAGGTARIELLPDGWYRCSITGAVNSSFNMIHVGESSASAVPGTVYLGTGKTVQVRKAKFVNTTAETDKTTVREYVSVGVESAPYYHGSFVDGVKCFPTDISGNPIPSTTMLGYQAEGARTNLCLQSQTLGTTWAGDASTSVTADQYVAPDGTTTMDKVTSLAGTSQHYLRQGITFSAGEQTYSCYLRYVNNQWAALIMSNGGGLLAASFDLLNGVVGALGAGTTSTLEATSIADVYRVSITGTMSAGAGNFFISPNATDTAGNENYTAAGTETVGAWGAQLELGSSASSYIPTTTAAVTRAADVLTYTGGDIPNLKTLAATFRREVGVSNVGVIVSLNNGTVSEYAETYLANATSVKFEGFSATSVQWQRESSNAYTPGASSTMAWSQATNDIKMAKDGVAQTADVSAALPSITTLSVGHVAGGFQLNGTIRGVYGWARNLSQSELGAITA